MRRSSLLLLAVLSVVAGSHGETPFDFETTPGKLPKQVVPEEYAIRIVPNVSLDEYRSISSVFSDDIYAAIDIKTCVDNRKVHGGPSKDVVSEAIKNGWSSVSNY
jgi:argininosuccinate lyase